MKTSFNSSIRLLNRLAFLGLFVPSVAFAGSTEEHRDAIDRFEAQFSGSGAFDCVSNKAKIGLGLGVLPYEAKLPDNMPKALLETQFGVEIETYPTIKTNHIDRLWGPANFSDDDRKMSVKLNNNKKAYFERFGPTPEWPFKSKKDSQFFFTFRLDDGPVFKCKAVYQPDQ